ncbi:LexA family transcriptional regulator [Parashewanella curva]|uniref:LexA family transcriptional regulator n=1 Tax=Parashewanella curva TaxID=2338552 RepID=A0A3L8Q3Z0_9GAMM|nr:S24 family peptidase [Parashewanella curva]RLV61752.1 LexA family transcriptional regulator [Parashewanella curva]
MKTLSERLTYAMNLAGMSQGRLARKVGIRQQSVYQLCSGKTLASKYTPHLAKALGIKVQWLVHGEGDMYDENVSSDLVAPKEIPVINWKQAARWPELVDTFSLTDTDEWMRVSKPAFNDCFVLRVSGDSMDGNSPKPSIQEGTLIIVQPCSEASSGQMVIAVLPNHERAIFRQYVTEADQGYLKPLNTQYPIIEINNECKIIGIVKQAISEF